ncbi:MAG: pyridoxal phosphate-dependent aminotransferase [Firmicutes bacterium]|nr:pyridoxal phosphate-dependent aminotransferase [Bacillota bacterium]
MDVSKRVAAMQFSPIRRFNTYAFEAEAEGKKVYRLNIGQPDVETPECFMDAIRDFDKKVIAYAESGGVTELVDAIIDYNKQYDMEFAREDILITNGGSEALTMIFTALLNPGEEAIIAEPFYTNYNTFCNQVNGSLVPITTKAEDGYAWADRELIEGAITENTKAICCISPGNPTGRVLTLDEMKLVGEIAKEHDLWIISDEVYREFAYDGRDVTSFGMLDDLADRVAIVDSVSKRFSACGARVGCVMSKNKELMSGILKLAQGRLCCPTLEQVGAAALYRLDKDYYKEAKAEYEGRRNAAYEELIKIPGVVCQKPGGAFYLTCKLPVEDAEDFLMFLLKEFDDKGETVMFAPAAGFYATPGLGKNEMRIAYVLNQESMRRGAELIRLGIEAYKNR